jgi:hypothetical protein
MVGSSQISSLYSVGGLSAGTSASLGTVVFYHIGTDSMFRTASVTKSFSIADGRRLLTTLPRCRYGEAFLRA